MSKSPAAPGTATGLPDKATESSVTFKWAWPEHTGHEELEGFEVAWIVVDWWVDDPPAEAEAILQHPRLQTVPLGTSMLEHCVEDMPPAGLLLPLVRCWNCVGYSAWSCLPRGVTALGDLHALPREPAMISVPPVLSRSPGTHPRPFALTLEWTVPPCQGREITHFDIRLTPVEQPTDPPVFPYRAGDVGNTKVHEFRFPRPAGAAGGEGARISVAGAHWDLVPGAAYVPEVRAVNEVGAAGWGVPGLAKQAPPALPLQPQAPTSPSQWPTGVEVTWVRPGMQGAEIEQLEVRYGTSPSLADAKYLPAEHTAEKMFGSKVYAGDLESATVYFFQLRVRNGLGWSPWSPVSKGYETGKRRPSPIRVLQVLALSWDSIRVSWKKPGENGAPVEQYEIILADGELSGRLSDLLARVNALEWDDLTGRERMLAALPPKARQMLGHTAEDASVTSCSPVSCRHRTQSGAWARASCAVADGDTREHAFANLLGGVYYSVAVRARNHAGWSDWTALPEHVITPSTIPEGCAPPLQVAATPQTLVVAWRIPYDHGAPIVSTNLHWTRIVAPSEQQLALGGAVREVRPDALEGEVLAPVPDAIDPAPPGGLGGEIRATILGLEPGAQYEVEVRATNAHGPGPYTAPVRMKTLACAPDAPGKLRHANAAGANGPTSVDGEEEESNLGSGHEILNLHVNGIEADEDDCD